MVFSFFKKPPPEKMVAKPAAAPSRAKPGAEAAPSAQPARPTGAVATPPVTPAKAADAAAKQPDDKSLDFVTPSQFSDLSSSPGDIELDGDMDPVEADIEQAAVLYANAQDEATRAILENAVHTHRYGPGERLWLMLFDLYRLANQHAQFDSLALEFAKCFEKSPPPWRDSEPAKAPVRAAAPGGTVLFKGQLLGDNDASFAALEQALDKVSKLRLELAKVKEIDGRGAERLLAALTKARRKGGEIELIGRDALVAALEQQTECGHAENMGCWLLLLELYQLMGRSDAFEDAAVNYAVTFEVSPPSWEAKRVAAPEPALAASPEGSADDGNLSVFPLKGDIKLERFGGLPAFVEKNDPVVLDLAAVTRIDFVSAGTLVNLLTPAKRAGKRVIIRHPNHLVAELLGVVGLRSVAEIAFART